MPATSIDSFFACTLIVIVVMVSMVATTRIVTPYIDSMQDLNEEEYLRKIVENILVSPGTPANWGENQTLTPTAFGLAKESSFTYELDRDKICRLNTNNTYALNYLEMFEAIRLEKVALRFTFTQIMDVSVTLDSNVTGAESSTYTFNISVDRNQAPVATSLHCYVVANNFLNDTYSSTSNTGQGVIEVEIPNTSNGTALLVVFAQSPYDNRVTAQGVCMFRHLSPEPLPNNTFLSLSPLNNTLLTDPNVSGVTLQTVYQFSYGYESSLSSTSNETFTVPDVLDSSPKLLVATGWNGSSFFVEYTTYPQVPTEMGANFEDAESYSFNYIVLVDQVLYRLNVQCGGPSL
ncbi:MAG: hypothetical protein NWF03_08420 [Candidatus Bathyarchaeota archaeon]|nr:hypothetical protein [Candidatus Bathyarchaeota archaeon]